VRPLAIVALVLAALVLVLPARASSPPPRRAHRAARIVFWVCPMAQDGSPVTTPAGVCFRDFAP
jgi:hypothetical protein